MIAVAPAAALSQRGHVFAFSFGNAGKAEGQFSNPDGIAVNSSTGDVYVADHKNKAVEQFKTTFNSEGQPIKEDFLRSLSVAAPSSIAVDNAQGSPSEGDVYVVGSAAAKTIFKFSSAGGADVFFCEPVLPGAGNARRSSLPLVVSGSASSSTKADGSI